MTTLLPDLRYAVRALTKSPGFTAVAVLTLALGLAANATVFSFVNDFFLRPLPARNPEQLVVIAQKSPQFDMPFPFSYPDYEDFRRAVEGEAPASLPMQRTFSGLTAYKDEAVHLSRPGEGSERTWLHVVSGDYFTVLGVEPFRGRLFLPEEGRKAGSDPIIVLTHDTWRSRFASDPRAIGQAVKVNGVSLTVIGVTPPGFVGAAWGTALSGFVPATMLPQLSPAHGSMIAQRGNTGFFLMGRLQTGTSLEQARAAVGVVMARLVKDNPTNFTPQVKAVVLRERMSRPSPFVASYVPLIVSALMTMALMVLGVAMANVANLLFARAADRQRELAIRGALGASRWRLVRQLLLESVLFALGAGVIGAIVAVSVAPYVGAMAPAGLAPPAPTGLDWRVFAFTVGASLATGILTGLIPALKATRLDVLALLKTGTRTMAHARQPVRSLLVVVQVAVSCVVLVCGGLALRSLHSLSQVALGFEPANLLLASFDLGLQRHDRDQGRQLQGQLLEKVRALPGVRGASLAEQVPFDVGGSMRGDISAEGRPREVDSRMRFIPCLAVEHAFLKTVGTSIVEGRDFAGRDDAMAPRVAIINRVLAEHLWPRESSIGKRLTMGGKPVEVVGLVGDLRFWSLTDRARPLVFLPLEQNYRGNVTLVARTESGPAQVATGVQQILRQLDPDLPLYNVRTMEEQMERSPLALMPLRVGATLSGAQGAIALLLVALGIYGVVSFAVARRTREIGIRVALGARTTDVIRLVLRQSLTLTVIGVGCGLLLAVGLTRMLASLLYDVSPADVGVFAGAALLATAATVLACWLPARRAARVDPIVALRCE